MADGQNKHTPKDSHYARLRRARMAAKQPSSQADRKRNAGSKPRGGPNGPVHIFGIHAVKAALENPNRVIRRMLVTRNAAARLGLPDLGALPFAAEFASPRDIDRMIGGEAVHQGVVIETEPLAVKDLADLEDADLVVVLDQVTDPHNVGAIMRSAVAFGAAALITTSRNSPGESSVLAKSASGALEHIDQIEVRNLAEALDRLHELGFQTIGLDSEADDTLERSFSAGKTALVLGAEGKGLRQKTRETVSVLARLEMPGPIRSLNVSNAAAISLYAARTHLEGR
jgi:23S rRNA (guanosine2251-2'-O)-methyltransferase